MPAVRVTQGTNPRNTIPLEGTDNYRRDMADSMIATQASGTAYEGAMMDIATSVTFSTAPCTIGVAKGIIRRLTLARFELVKLGLILQP